VKSEEAEQDNKFIKEAFKNLQRCSSEQSAFLHYDVNTKQISAQCKIIEPNTVLSLTHALYRQCATLRKHSCSVNL